MLWIHLELILRGEHNTRVSSINCFCALSAKMNRHNSPACLDLWTWGKHLFLHLRIVDGLDDAVLQKQTRTAIAGVSRSSYVSFLKANHTTASFSVAVLKKGGNDFPAKVCLWCSLLCGHLEAFDAGLQCADGIDLSLEHARSSTLRRKGATP